MIGIDSRVGQELKMGGILAQTKGQEIIPSFLWIPSKIHETSSGISISTIVAHLSADIYKGNISFYTLS
jgi:hypothetical protein